MINLIQKNNETLPFEYSLGKCSEQNKHKKMVQYFENNNKVNYIAIMSIIYEILFDCSWRDFIVDYIISDVRKTITNNEDNYELNYHRNGYSSIIMIVNKIYCVSGAEDINLLFISTFINYSKLYKTDKLITIQITPTQKYTIDLEKLGTLNEIFPDLNTDPSQKLTKIKEIFEKLEKILNDTILSQITQIATEKKINKDNFIDLMKCMLCCEYNIRPNETTLQGLLDNIFDK